MVVDPGRLAELIEQARPVAERLASAGYQSYIVGGLVRDLHLDRTSSPDFDITTDARPEVVKSLLAEVAEDLWAQGERFGTIGLRLGEIVFEVTTHRSDSYATDSRKPVVEFSTAIEEDLSRRDFTVNAMAIDISSGELVDPFGGAEDLRAKMLRTPESPQRSFDDDPLRMLRAARFHAGYHLDPAPGLEDAIREMASRIDIVSEERIRDETTKLLAVDRPGAGIDLLGRAGMLQRIVPGYDARTASDVAALVDGVIVEPVVRRAAFYLVLAERQGLDDLRGHLVKRRHSSLEKRETVAVLAAAIELGDRESFGADDFGVRSFVARTGTLEEAAKEIVALERLAGSEAVARYEERRARLASRESLTTLHPALTGAQVMSVLDISGGPDVGSALAFLMSVRLSEGELSLAEATDRLLEWWSERQ